MTLRLIVACVVTYLLALAPGVAAQNREPATGGGVGAFWGAGVWIGLTLLLLIGVIIVAYQASKRPNKD